MLLVVDDLQWAEPSTVLLLGHLARRAVPRFALVATARHGESGKAPVDLFGDLGTTRSIEIIEAGGLDDGEVAELVALHAGDTPPEGLSAQLHRHTDGNPFFLAAVLAHLEDVAFVRCKLDLSSLRGAKLRNVTFENCVLDDADVTAAEIRETRFDGCTLHRVLIDGVRMRSVDLRGSDLSALDPRQVELRGAVVTYEQALALAAALGLDIRAE